jgi:hypothetical protein
MLSRTVDSEIPWKRMPVTPSSMEFSSMVRPVIGSGSYEEAAMPHSLRTNG